MAEKRIHLSAQRRRRSRAGRCGEQHEWHAAPPLQSDDPAHAEVDVGRSLRQLREERNLSIRALAEQSGLAVNTLSLIENGKTSPSVSTLQQLAAALAVPITAFFEHDTPARPVIYTRHGRRPRAAFDQGTLEHLSAGVEHCPVELFLVTLAPESRSGSSAIVHGGHEFVLCMVGRIVYTVHYQEYILEPGDSLLFEAHLPHCWYNIHYTESQMLVMFCAAPEQRPDHLHFVAQDPQDT